MWQLLVLALVLPGPGAWPAPGQSSGPPAASASGLAAQAAAGTSQTIHLDVPERQVSATDWQGAAAVSLGDSTASRWTVHAGFAAAADQVDVQLRNVQGEVRIWTAADLGQRLRARATNDSNAGGER